MSLVTYRNPILYSLLAVSEVTLFFQDGQQELAAGLTLTVMLVTYTMYQSISESTAKTAYLKMLDYWLFFCLLIPFVTFMIEVSWFSDKSIVKGPRITTDKRFAKILTKSCVKFLVPAITIIFMILYFTAAFICAMLS